jgi:hypothetical protein
MHKTATKVVAATPIVLGSGSVGNPEVWPEETGFEELGWICAEKSDSRKCRIKICYARFMRTSVLYCDHIEADGEKLFAVASKRDLEGIVAKHSFGPYLQDSAQWFKIRNRKYSRGAGREKFFERERGVDPDIFLWDSCVFACENV